MHRPIFSKLRGPSYPAQDPESLSPKQRGIDTDLAMPVPLLSKAPTCLSCLRQTWTGRSRTAAAVLVGLTQVRGKKRSGRPRDQGVVVRLLRDVSTYGRRGTIFRIERGRMRNILYPEGKAEYMTRGRFAELGLSVADTLGERDFQFGAGLPGAADAQEEEAESRAEQQRQATAEVPSLSVRSISLVVRGWALVLACSFF